MNTQPTGSPRRQAAPNPARRAMKQFAQTEAEAGRGAVEIDQPPPQRQGVRGTRKAEPPGQLDPGSSPYEEPGSEQSDR